MQLRVNPVWNCTLVREDKSVGISVGYFLRVLTQTRRLGRICFCPPCTWRGVFIEGEGWVKRYWPQVSESMLPRKIAGCRLAPKSLPFHSQQTLAATKTPAFASDIPGTWYILWVWDAWEGVAQVSLAFSILSSGERRRTPGLTPQALSLGNNLALPQPANLTLSSLSPRLIRVCPRCCTALNTWRP